MAHFQKNEFLCFVKAIQGKRRTRCVADSQFISAFAQPLILPNLYYIFSKPNWREIRNLPPNYFIYYLIAG